METSSSEQLDIVDDNDRVIGSATRGEIHQRGLRHRSVHVLVFNGCSEILLQKRSMQKDQCGGMWDTSCAGHVESGQSYEETAPRELQEELGFSPALPLQPLFKMNPTKNNGYEFAMVYSIEYPGPFIAAEDELDQLKWFPFQDVDDWVARYDGLNHPEPQDLTSGFMEIWSRYRVQSV